MAISLALFCIARASCAGRRRAVGEMLELSSIACASSWPKAACLSAALSARRLPCNLFQGGIGWPELCSFNDNQ